MIAITIDPETPDWILFNEEYQGCISISADDLKNTTRVLFAVKLIFHKWYGEETVNSRSPLSVLHCGICPQAFPSQHLIFLCSEGWHPARIAYQFSHELFHVMLPGKVCDDYEWLNETLAELSSLLTLSRIAESFLELLADIFTKNSLMDYIKNERKKEYPCPRESIPDYIQQNLPYLRQIRYDRNMNRTIANALFNLFHENPSLWRVMLHLPNFTASKTLKENLESLKAVEPAETCSIDKLIHVLCG